MGAAVGGSIQEDERFIFERIKDRYDTENKTSDSIDISASNLVGWNGLIISVLLAGGGFLLSSDPGLKLAFHEWLFLSWTLGSLGVSLILSFVAFRKGSYYVVPDARSLIEDYNGLAASDILKAVSGTMADAVDKNAGRNEARTNIVTASQVLFLAGMFGALIFLGYQSYKIIGS